MDKGKSHHRTGYKSIYRHTHDHCPIYVHEFEKTFDKKNILSFHNENSKKSKSVLNKIEETYWANWKPSKTKSISAINEVLLNNISNSQLKVQDHGDFDNCKSSQESSKDLVKEIEAKSSKNLVEDNPNDQNVNDNNIQGDSSKTVKNEEPDPSKAEELLTTNKIAVSLNERKDSVDKNSSDEKEAIEDSFDSLKHTDSIILAKRRQKIVKEYFQQPKCIRLYKKLNLFNSKCVVKTTTGTTASLKPILKMESSIKETFHMGPPGSSILMTTSSYVRKSTKRIL